MIFLVVTEDPGFRSALTTLCECLGHEVEQAENAPTALIVMRARRHDCVICEETVLDRGGMQLLENCRAEGFQGGFLLLAPTEDEKIAKFNGDFVPWRDAYALQQAIEKIERRE